MNTKKPKSNIDKAYEKIDGYILSLKWGGIFRIKIHLNNLCQTKFAVVLLHFREDLVIVTNK